MRHTFPKSSRLRSRRQYQRLSHAQQRQAGHWLVVDSSPNLLTHIRLGVTVTRRFGKAHDRNRFKRLVREAFRLCLHELPKGIDINVKPRSAAHHAKMQDVITELKRLLLDL